MMNATMIIGECCTGKSTIMKALLAEGVFRFRKDMAMARHEDALDGIVVFGDYSDLDHQFPGTDRLGMAIKPIAMEHAHDYGLRGWHVIFEGQRLGNGKVIDELRGMGFRVRVGVTMTHGPDLAVRRALERHQKPTMIKRVGTQVRNIVDRYADIVTLLRCDKPADTQEHVRWIKSMED